MRWCERPTWARSNRARDTQAVTIKELQVPKDVERVVATLTEAGHAAYVVGGCVRDAIRGVDPQDWDVATDATPEEIQKLFKKSLYTNRFGTVIVRSGDHEVEVTTYRTEADYSDHRRPDQVAFTDSLQADLSRRDFTMNAMAWRPGKNGTPGQLVDPFGGQRDLESRVLRAVGEPELRFREDALRMLRAVRFATLLDMRIDEPTVAAIRQNAHLAATLSGERINQEMVKILGAPRPSVAFRMLSDVGLLEVLCPELEESKKTPQDKVAALDVFEHSLATLDATPPGDLVLRLAGLFHDIGKPETFADGHFHQHEFVGEFKARQILRRWKFDKETVAEVTHLIRNHMFWYETHWTDSAVRRFIRKIGLDYIPALFALRRADNIGSGARSPRMYALEALWQRVQEQIAAANAFSPRDLVIDGNDVMRELGIPPGPEVGRILSALFERVLDEPALNSREKLIELAKAMRA
jgi:tRNA nucleotidyltransferase (CCA-adding enzyme)